MNLISLSKLIETMGHMIDLVSVEGGIPLKINRFILQLHNTFFHSLLLEHQHQDLVIIFSDTEISELKAIKASVLEKHILCANFDLTYFKRKVATIEEVTSSKKVKVDFDEDQIDIYQKPKNVIKETVSVHTDTETHHQPDKNVTLINEKETRPKALKLGQNYQEKGELKMRCPFADEDSEEIVTSNPNEIYAHILCKHDNLIENNHQLSFDRFMKHLEKVIELKCFFKCHRKLKKGKCGLKHHYRLYHIEEEIMCDHCSKTFKNKEKLLLHKKLFVNTSSFTCHLCGKEFPIKHNLTMHIMNVHEKENFKSKCEICSKAFSCSSRLKIHHDSIHEKSKPFVCDICGTKMSRFANLSDHRFKVHGEKFSSIHSYRDLIDKKQHIFIEA